MIYLWFEGAPGVYLLGFNPHCEVVGRGKLNPLDCGARGGATGRWLGLDKVPGWSLTEWSRHWSLYRKGGPKDGETHLLFSLDM